ncbi:hypothetical protein FJTKL_05760 [Diaporthe vaccinii]|uniref:Uncharacterized protein n=1 Tax=Diaporthe vaccinii TaxID=105482 RepID=A0ABR4EXS7_9PEZI
MASDLSPWSLARVYKGQKKAHGMIQMFWLCSLFGRVFIDFNYTFAPRLKVGRLPTREEAARSPVYPDHLFVFFQTQFQMLQEVVPNNWIGIPGNTSDPDTSKAYSKKLLAPYDALVRLIIHRIKPKGTVRLSTSRLQPVPSPIRIFIQNNPKIKAQLSSPAAVVH